jgi:NADH:ubiquinone oxidoreductase subunit 3 (subunit A)
LNGGIATAFTVAALISIAAVILAFFIRNSKPPVEEQSMEYELGAGEQPVSDEAATRN